MQMLIQREQQQLQSPQSVQREEVLGVVWSLQISFHQLRGPLSRRLSIVMVVQLGLSCSRDAVLLWRRLSLRGLYKNYPMSKLEAHHAVRVQIDKWIER